MYASFIHKSSMYLCPMYSNDLIKGTLRTIILKLLSENTKMYGYEITQKVKELTDDEIQLTEGALYPMLHKLEAEGTVVTEQINIGKRVRKYYQLTDQGKEEAKEKVNEFLRFIDTMKDVLNHKNSFQPWLS
jgi:PadR family transcriptional regulator, regulatory protein PadR